MRSCELRERRYAEPRASSMPAVSIRVRQWCGVAASAGELQMCA